jgi:hypothetical protein
VADDEKVVRVILTHPEMSRTEKVIVTIGWVFTMWQILRPLRPPKHRG